MMSNRVGTGRSPGKMVWLDRADVRRAVIRLGSKLGKATDSDLKNAERGWSYRWETRGKTQMILPMVMDQMDTLEERRIPHHFSTVTGQEEKAVERRSLSGMVSWVKNPRVHVANPQWMLTNAGPQVGTGLHSQNSVPPRWG
jgi:hypothetical protein